MRFCVICLLCTVAATGATQRNGAAASEEREVAELTGEQRGPHAASEERTYQASPLTEHSSVKGRPTMSLRDAAVAVGENVHVKGQRPRQSQQQEQHHGDRRTNSGTTKGGRLRATRKRQPTTAATADSTHNDEQGDGKHNVKERAKSSNSHGQGRKAEANGVEKKEAVESGLVAGAPELPQTLEATGEGTAEPERQTKDEGAADPLGVYLKSSKSNGSHGEGRKAEANDVEETNVGKSGDVAGASELTETLQATEEGTAGHKPETKDERAGDPTDTHVDTPAATTAQSGQKSNALTDIPMTREQRLELLLDYSISLPYDADRDKCRKSSCGRSHKSRTRPRPSPSGTERQQTSSYTQRTRRGRQSMATAQLLEAARLPSNQRWQKWVQRTARSKHVRAVALGAAFGVSLAVLARAHGHEDRGAVAVDMTRNSPQFAVFRTWAAQRRAALGVQPEVLPPPGI